MVDAIGFQKFQFHKGTIKTVALKYLGREVFHFNSIKVQLKQIRNSFRKAFN